MKKHLFLATIFTLLLSSCSTIYVQLYSIKMPENFEETNQKIVYEDENCKISYDLWAEGGDIGFQFLNKTDKNIYLDLEESFFILNGISYNYYKNRFFSKSNSSNLYTNNGLDSSNPKNSFSVSYNEEKIVLIPPKTSKIISEYNINKEIFIDCDLPIFPKGKINSKEFSKNESPLTFSNRISYSLNKTSELIVFENEFYVNKITNYPEKKILVLKREEHCGKKAHTRKKVFRKTSPKNFYITYKKKHLF